MGTTGWLILIVVVLVVVAAVAWAVMGNRRKEAHREQAMELREDAVQSTAAIDASRREAEEAAARAEVARAEAERAEQDASLAQQGVVQEEARVEDRLREADRVDPDVDTRSEEYRPGEPTTSPETGGGVAYADPAERPVDGSEGGLADGSADGSAGSTHTDVTGRPLDDRSDTDPDDPAHEHRHRHRAPGT